MKLKQLTIAQQLFKRFCDGYNHRDLRYLRSLFTKNVIMWGTGVDEYRNGLQQVEEQLLWDWEQYDDAVIKLVTFNPAHPNSFWASASCEINVWLDGQNFDFQYLRGTLCIDLEEEDWKIAHLHISFPKF